MASFAAINRLVLQRLRLGIQNQKRFVSTSKKNNDTVVADVCNTTSKSSKVAEKNWMSYGYDFNSKADDRSAMHIIMFTSITLCMVLGGLIWGYSPDLNMKDWSVREAFIELRRREAAGGPLVDPNLIPVEKIVLPTDEELGETEIII